MGLRHSKPPEKNYSQLLEKIEDQIGYFERSERQLRLKEWHIDVGVFVFIVLSYVLLLYIAYYRKSGGALFDLLWVFILLFGYPCLIYVVRRIIGLYFHRRLSHCSSQLSSLRKERLEVIKEVKDKEPYNVAKQLLDRFETPFETPVDKRLHLRTPRTGPVNRFPSGTKLAEACGDVKQHFEQSSEKALPRPIPPYQRSIWDKIVDVVLRDGPSNRYALICVYCKGHNGMAMAEEFEDMSFRCCYCSMLNPTKRQSRLRKKTDGSTIAAKPPTSEPEGQLRSHSEASSLSSTESE